MDKITNYFSDEEIEEIKVSREGTEAMSVDGKEIICFRVLADIVSKRVDIKDIPRNELLISYAQLKGYKEIFESFGIVDVTILNRVVNKAKKLFLNELESRR